MRGIGRVEATRAPKVFDPIAHVPRPDRTAERVPVLGDVGIPRGRRQAAPAAEAERQQEGGPPSRMRRHAVLRPRDEEPPRVGGEVGPLDRPARPSIERCAHRRRADRHLRAGLPRRARGERDLTSWLPTRVACRHEGEPSARFGPGLGKNYVEFRLAKLERSLSALWRQFQASPEARRTTSTCPLFTQRNRKWFLLGSGWSFLGGHR